MRDACQHRGIERAIVGSTICLRGAMRRRLRPRGWRLLPEQQTDESMNKGEPPSASGPTLAPFLIGKNRHGDWVVQDTSGLRGGLFVDRTQALKFAMWECGNRPQAVIMVPEGLELDMSAKPSRELALRR
jgi:hypothetical protein